jgi:DNA-binding transcriptional LysR family regulator
LHLTDRPLHLVDQGFDLIVRVGESADLRLGSRRIARNRRLLCAAPSYLDAHGTPAAPRDLAQHRCLFIRESDETFGTWHLRKGARQETLKVRGSLSTNDGESASAWALRGHGILMRSEWEIAPCLRDGRLVRVLEDWETAPADVFVEFQTGNHRSAKTRALIDWLVGAFRKHRDAGAEDFHGW